MSDPSPEISIIIPTYNERENIAAVVRDIFAIAVRRGYSLEVIIVDDNSPDGTGHEAEYLAKVFPVVVIHRKTKLGLGSALVEGFARARGRIWGMMDGDRSHPAEALPDLIEPIRQGRCQLALASRYAPGGAVEYWPGHRWVLSRVATWIGRVFARVRDPLSGFLFFERSVIAGVPLTVRGYKIGLEILVKGRYDSWIEVPYTFRNREVGRSKLGWAEYINYLQSIFHLARYVFHHRDEWRERRCPKSLETGGAPIEPTLLDKRGAIPCPLCGANKSRFLLIKNTYRYVRCRSCGLVFVNPMPSAEELETIYDDPLYFANRNEWAYGYNDYFAERRFYTPLFDRRVRQCERTLGVTDGRGRRLLEVGCAAGFLLEVAGSRGWEVAGVEMSRHAAEFANKRLGGVVRIGSLEQAQLDSDSFDAAVMLDVIEHVANPVALLREVKRVVKPGGVLLLSAPNVRSLLVRLLGRRWFHFKRDHVILFSAPTLLRALEAAGFDCFCLQRNGKMVSLNYLFARLKTYLPAFGRLLLATVGRFHLCERLFYDSWTGEFLAFCRKRDDSGATTPSPNEIYSRFRAHWWPPTALWRAAEYFRLRNFLSRDTGILPANRHGQSARGGHATTGLLPVLDLGCGDGFFARQIFPTSLRDQIVGADRDFHGLQALKKKEGNGRAVCADLKSLPFRSGSVGSVLSNCTLEHVEEVGVVLSEVARILKPGGQLVFTVPSEDFGRLLSFSDLLAKVGLQRIAQGYAGLLNRILGHRNIFAPEKWRELLQNVGLRLEQVESFMPQPLARAWGLRLWWGIPAFLVRRFMKRREFWRPRPRRLPPSYKLYLLEPCARGAGAVYYCVKPSSPSVP